MRVCYRFNHNSVRFKSHSARFSLSVSLTHTPLSAAHVFRGFVSSQDVWCESVDDGFLCNARQDSQQNLLVTLCSIQAHTNNAWERASGFIHLEAGLRLDYGYIESSLSYLGIKLHYLSTVSCHKWCKSLLKNLGPPGGTIRK